MNPFYMIKSVLKNNYNMQGPEEIIICDNIYNINNDKMK